MQTGHPDIEQLSAWLEGDLEPATHASLQAHVAGCAHCQAEVEGLREFLSVVQHLPELEAPAGFTQRVLERVEQAERRTFRYWMARLKLPTLLVPVTVAALALFMIRQPEQESLEVESIQRWEQAGSDGLQEAEAVPAGEAAAPAPSAPAPSVPATQDLMAKARVPAASAPADVEGVAQGGGAQTLVAAQTLVGDQAPGRSNAALATAPQEMPAAESGAARPASGPVPAELPPLERLNREADAFAPAPADDSRAEAPAVARPQYAPSPSRLSEDSARVRGVVGEREGDTLPTAAKSSLPEKPISPSQNASEQAPQREMARSVSTQDNAPALSREEAVARSAVPLGAVGGLGSNKGAGGSAGYGSAAGLGAAPERKRADELAKAPEMPAAAVSSVAVSGGMAAGSRSGAVGAAKSSAAPEPRAAPETRADAPKPSQEVAITRAPASTPVRDLLTGGRSKKSEAPKSQSLAEAIEAQASSSGETSEDGGSKDKDSTSQPPFWQDQLPPDAVVVIQDRAGLDGRLTRIVRLLKAQRSPIQRLENNRRRVILQLKPDQYPLLIQQLDRHSDFGATPPPGKPTTQRVWVEIVPVVP